MTEIALITGCATGIGRALALDMHSRKLESGDAAFKVYATDYRYAHQDSVVCIGGHQKDSGP